MSWNNEHDYAMCREQMEELWLEEGKSPFFEGLLHLAGGMEQAAQGHTVQAAQLLREGIVFLSFYPREHMGLNIARLLADMTAYSDQLEQEDSEHAVPHIPLHIVHSELAALVEQL